MRGNLFFGAATAALLALGATSALAQSEDPAGDASTQARLEPGQPANGEIAPEGDADWYRLHVQAGMRYQFNLNAVEPEAAGEGQPAVLDPVLRIMSQDGEELAFNDDSPDSLNSSLRYAPQRDGDVFVAASGFSDTSVGRYVLSVAASTAPPDDVGDTVETRAHLTLGQDATGELESEGDVDWYRLNVRTGQRYVITLNGGEEAGQLRDPLVRVLSREGEELVANDDSEGSLNSRVELVPQSSGYVFVEAGGYGGAQTGRYTVRAVAEALPDDPVAGDRSTRARIEPGHSETGALEYSTDRDWYRIRLSEGETYRFALDGAGDKPLADPLLRLLDARGEQLALDDDGGEGLNSYLEFAAPRTGDYFLEARGFSDDAEGGYTLTARAGDIPADATTDVTLSAEGESREGVLSPAGDRDWFRLELAQGQGVRIGLRGADGDNSLGDALVRLLGPNGEELAVDDDGGEGLNSLLEFDAPAAGVYFVEARGFSDNEQGRYVLTVSGEIGAASDTAEALHANGEPVQSTLGTNDDVDWFAINMIEARPYRLNVRGAGENALADPVLTLLDAEGNKVALDDDGGTGAASYLTYTPLASGVYYAAVSSHGASSSGRYEIWASDTDVPAAPYAEAADEVLDAAGDDRTSRIDMPGDKDLFRVELEAGVRYVIDVAGAGDTPLANPALVVLDSSNERAAADDDSGPGANARLVFTPETSGTYFLQASGGESGGVGWYKISIARRSPPSGAR